jgi:hypothetical protein
MSKPDPGGRMPGLTFSDAGFMVLFEIVHAPGVGRHRR